MGPGRHNARDEAASKMRTQNFDQNPFNGGAAGAWRLWLQLAVAVAVEVRAQPFLISYKCRSPWSWGAAAEMDYNSTVIL